MKSITASALVLAALLIPSLASAAISFSFGISFGNTCITGICVVANNILYIINSVLVPVLFAVAFIVFLYGIAQAYIFSVGDPEKVKQGHTLLLWGLIGFVVMISLWGLVNVIANTFGLSGAFAPPTPSSISPYGSVVPPGGTVQPQTFIECPKKPDGTCI